MVVNTQRLFVRLLRAMQINAVCDVGSMNGAEALKFRAVVPTADIFALEAHPGNFCLMQASPALRENNIAVLPLAATDYDGEGEFFMTNPGYSPGDAWRGMSSLYKRFRKPELLTAVPVRTARLDTVLASNNLPGLRLALWIDTEGKAYEVIKGSSGLFHNLYLLHIEVETSQCIAEEQKFYPQIEELLHSCGFIELATDQVPSKVQFNALFIRSDLPAVMQYRVRQWLVLARVRYLLVGLVRALSPGFVRWYRSKRP